VVLKNADTEFSPRISPRNWLLPVINNQNTPPAIPNDGDRYRVTAVATGAWAGQENTIAVYEKDSLQWRFFALIEPQIWYDMTSQNWHYMSHTGVITQFDKIPLAISDVTGLQTALDGKAPLVHKTNHVVGGSDPFVAGDNLDATAKVGVKINSGARTGARRDHNFIAGSNVTISAVDNVGSESVDITINSVGSGGHPLLDGAVDSDTVAVSPVSQDLIYSNGTPKWDRFPKGANGSFMSVVAGLLTWRTLTAADIPAIAESGVTGLVADLASKENTANKNVANGYAGLDASTLLSLSQMPSGVGKRVASGTMGADAISLAIASGLATGKHHYVLYVITKTDAGGIGLRFNGDAGANYDTSQLVGGSGTSTGLTNTYFVDASILNVVCFLKVEIMNNNLLDNNVYWFSEVYFATHSSYKNAGVYFGAADITSMTLYSLNGSSVPSGNLKANTTFILYEVA
jgi:hypothetical protein